VLDLEAIAHHRGSVLGNHPQQAQPSQKAFDTALWHALNGFDPAAPVYIEAESKKIGEVRVPDTLIHAMWKSTCVRVELGFEQRVTLLQEDYAHFFSDPANLCAKLDGLTQLHGKLVVEKWKALAHGGNWRELTAELLTRHYDPLYRRSLLHNYPQLEAAEVVRCSDAGAAAMQQAARQILKQRVAAESPA
jgi:tRNA 2-selenouridine synthase